MKTTGYDYIICGGGASGLLLAHQLILDPYFKEKQILLIEKDNKTQNDRTWCFWETPSGAFDDLITHQWGRGKFKSDLLHLDFKFNPLVYKMLRSAPFYQKIYTALNQSSNCKIVRETIKTIQSQSNEVVITTENYVFKGSQVFTSLFDPNILNKQKQYPVLQQHFLGWFVETKTDVFDPKQMTFMDFSIPQKNNTRFMYILPFDTKKALIEYTLFSEKLLERKEYEQELNIYLEKLGVSYTILEKEQGSIPMCSYPMSQHNTARILHIGTAGGWTKASTGYTFKNTQQKTKRLVAFLKKQKPLNRFQKRNRFWVYDLLFLDVLYQYNAQGSALFSRLFQKNKPHLLFRFLSEETRFWEELIIMSSFRGSQIRLFLVALFKRLY